ncbi:pentapeptide repeat-containing protein [Amycolatopsis acidiphila]|uniref:pentapeptide repeat-containing protein n=1 Tax=Amycolatopsis acidiphila TaxID=715473 RepID=UPI001643E9CA|nr:pentapeptide repeat-containing protein [Amycolatopsis acidiphila]UIJ57900.1 pentapeptide repeat-containing protein [Amycolatopsis acidiphila]
MTNSIRTLFADRGPTAIASVVVLITVLAVAFVAIWWRVPDMLYPPGPDKSSSMSSPEYQASRISATASTRSALLLGLAGIAAIGTLLVNLRNTRVAVATLQVANENAQVAIRNVQIAERGHFTDRFAKAVEQLGGTSIIISLGGVYSLQQLMREGSAPGDPKVIASVICAFIRVKSPTIGSTPEKDRKHEVGAALQVLCSTQLEERLTGLDLSRSRLRGHTIWGDNLRNAQFDYSDLSGSFLQGVDLTGAAFAGTNLSNTILVGATLNRATFSLVVQNPDIHRNKPVPKDLIITAKMDDALMSGASLSEARLHDVDFSRTIGLTQEQVDQAVGNGGTLLPPGIKRPAWWPQQGLADWH